LINNTRKPIVYLIVTLISVSAVFSAVYADDISNLIGDTGFVGIGTTTPTAELDVVGDIKLSGNLISDGDICIGNCDDSTPNVSDQTPPVITLLGNNPQTIELGSGYSELGATTDDGSSVIIDSSAFVDAVGTYSITYDSIDSVGNVATQVIRTVEVVSTPSGITATGGTITHYNGKVIHTFTSDGIFTVTSGTGEVEYLVIGGGGGGAGSAGTIGGGGGAGAFRIGTGHIVTVQAYPITIGAGGAGGPAVNVSGAAGGIGGDSTFDTITSVAGGFGGAQSYAAGSGSGSGGGSGWSSTTFGTGGDYGNGGGCGHSSCGSGAGGGGGGGAGGIGGDGSGTNGGTGGIGLSTSISGSSVCYAGGGGGGVYSGGTDAAATCGGGTGKFNTSGIVGAANTGGGGGASGSSTSATGGAGGSGIIIISYSDSS
jgi:hypothetical protein